MPKKPQPQISPILSKTSDKRPRVGDSANSSSRCCGTCETLAVPPARPRLRVKGISVNAVLAQPLRCRKGFLGVWVLLAGQPGVGGKEVSPRNTWGADSDPWGPRALSAPHVELSPTSGRASAEERLELWHLPTAQLCSRFSSITEPGLALLFLGLSQGITLLSPFWEKEAFRSIGAHWSWCLARPQAARAAEPAALTAGDGGCYARARTRTCTARKMERN